MGISGQPRLGRENRRGTGARAPHLKRAGVGGMGKKKIIGKEKKRETRGV